MYNVLFLSINEETLLFTLCAFIFLSCNIYSLVSVVIILPFDKI